MYNDWMTISSFEIRVCASCGLRYPLVEGHPFGRRCPACAGDTRLALARTLTTETHDRDEPENDQNKTLAVLLDNIRSAWNVGSILRSADGFGFSHAFICGITPTADQEAVAKTALGAEQFVPWSYHKDGLKLVKGLQSEGWKLFALEEDRRAVGISQAHGLRHANGRKALIVGNEVTGIDPELLDLCDQILYIPMRGEKKSFNVAIAFGIAAYASSLQEEET